MKSKASVNQRSIKRIPVRTASHVVNPADPFAEDVFSREDFVRAIANVIDVAEGPIVIALDGAWGTGKSVALKMLQSVLETKEHTVVNFNAWQADHATDPLVALAAEFLTQTVKKQSSAALKSRAQRIIQAVQKVAKPFVSMAVKAATGSLLDLAKLEKEMREAAEESASTAAEGLIDRFLEEKVAMKVFRDELKHFTDEAAKADRNVVVLIDELDRCRPTFAIELLERVKHLFDVEGLMFVVAVHREELAHSVKSIYGAEFNGAQYLNRFFDLECRLPRSSNETLVRSRLATLGLDPYFALDPSLKQDCAAAILRFADKNRYSPRELLAFIGRIGLALLQRPAKDAPLAPLMVGLLMLREERPDLFARVRQKSGDAVLAAHTIDEAIGQDSTHVIVRVAVELWISMMARTKNQPFDFHDFVNRPGVTKGRGHLYRSCHEAFRSGTAHDFEVVLGLIEFAAI